MDMKCTNIARPSKIYQNLDFWFENIPSGNPVQNDVVSEFEFSFEYVLRKYLEDRVARWFLFKPKIPM
jgi:hypothetical protein